MELCVDVLFYLGFIPFQSSALSVYIPNAKAKQEEGKYLSHTSGLHEKTCDKAREESYGLVARISVS